MKLLPFDFSRIEADKILLTNVAGEFIVLDNRSFQILCNEDFEWLNNDIKNMLLARHFIANDDTFDLSIGLLANKLASKKSYLNDFTALHMIVLTLRCNCMCTYCHASSKGGLDDRKYDMNESTAIATVDTIFKSPSTGIKIEFQGGEPTLNWDILKKIVTYAEDKNLKAKKSLSFIICTNLLNISDEQLRFLKDHNVFISTSCDGPKELHDCCRKSLVSNSAYEMFVHNVERIRNIFGNSEPSALLTVTKNNLHHLREVIDVYRKLGFNNLFIRALNPYGYAIDNYESLAYRVEDFVEAYKEALAYIIELNLNGEHFVESYASIILQRILTPFSTGFVDLQSPCGAGIAGAIYYYNGDVYPADEGRMLAAKEDYYFRLGNVKKTSYKEMFDGELIHNLVKNSCVECMPGCANCAFKSYCGADPIRYYVESKDIIGKRYNSDFCKKNKLIIKEILKYVLENDPKIMKIFWSWINRKPVEDYDDNH